MCTPNTTTPGRQDTSFFDGDLARLSHVVNSLLSFIPLRSGFKKETHIPPGILGISMAVADPTPPWWGPAGGFELCRTSNTLPSGSTHQFNQFCNAPVSPVLRSTRRPLPGRRGRAGASTRSRQGQIAPQPPETRGTHVAG